MLFLIYKKVVSVVKWSSFIGGICTSVTVRILLGLFHREEALQTRFWEMKFNLCLI